MKQRDDVAFYHFLTETKWRENEVCWNIIINPYAFSIPCLKLFIHTPINQAASGNNYELQIESESSVSY